MKIMKCIYIAGKLNADNAVDYLKNVNRMCEWDDRIRFEGFATFNPALDLILGIKYGDYNYNNYFDNNANWLLKADAVFVCPEGYKTSKGTKKEIKLALEHDIPVFYDIDSLCLNMNTKAYINQYKFRDKSSDKGIK